MEKEIKQGEDQIKWRPVCRIGLHTFDGDN